MNKRDKKRLDSLYKKLCSLKKTFLGYPCDAEFDYSELYRFLEFPINNVGDPWEHSTYRLQTKEFEQEALSFFAKLFNLKGFWGYVTNGGTEGNLYGLYVARETLPKAKVFYSEDTHYSIKKNIHLLNLKGIQVKSQSNGEIDYKDLEKKAKNTDRAIVVANIGTTMKGAIDNPQKIARVLKGKKYYIHADAALYGMILPFLSNSKFDFRTPISSMAVSGHKFIGSPIPCGVVLTKKKLTQNVKNYIEYIDAHDTTLSGSRDAFTPLLLWYRIKTLGLSGFKKQAEYSDNLAKYLVQELEKIGWQGVNRSYITVRFKKPSWKTIMKWELAVDRNTAHVICLPHDSKEQLDQFIKDLKKEVKRN